jgi:hypothetical protein
VDDTTRSDAAQGTEDAGNVSTAADAEARLTGANERLEWADLDHEEQLGLILSTQSIAAWCATESLETLTYFRKIPQQWALIKARYKELGGYPPDLEKAVDAQLRIDLGSEAPPAQAGEQAERKRFTTISAKELLAKHIAPVEEIVEGVLPAGLTLLSGRAKDGKTRMASDIALAVSTDGKALGRYKVKKGTVLCQLLEDGERRAQIRLREYLDAMQVKNTPENMYFVLWSTYRIGEGFEECVKAWLEDHPDTCLIVIDIFEKVRPKRVKNDPLYASDYAALAPLQKLAQEANISILVITHSNKGKHEDARDTIGGTMGLAGACDTLWTLRRVAGKADAELHITGRDVEEQTLAMQFQDGFWSVIGDAAQVNLGDRQQAILDYLQSQRSSCTPTHIATAINAKASIVRTILQRMVMKEIITSPSHGLYISPHLSQERECVDGESQQEGEQAVDAVDAVDAGIQIEREASTESVERLHPSQGETLGVDAHNLLNEEELEHFYRVASTASTPIGKSEGGALRYGQESPSLFNDEEYQQMMYGLD